MALHTLRLCLQTLPLLQSIGLASSAATVHPWPGGGTYQSPNYFVDVDGANSFVWYTAAANRQAVAEGNLAPSTPLTKDTSYTMFDMSADGSPAQITVQNLLATVDSVEIRPVGRGIVAELSGNSFTFTLTEPQQVCAVINGDADKPLCIFADPAQEDPPTESSDDLIYFGPGVHYPGKIDLTEGQTVYLAGGAHVYGQIVAESAKCNGCKVLGRGVLDGHNLPIDYRAYAMVDLKYSTDLYVEGITTVDSPMYQSYTFAPRGTIRWVKSIAWGFTTDGFGGGEYSLVENCFFKVNDDSSKLFFTGAVVRNNVYWQMENGCPLMMSWNTAYNAGFVTVTNNAVIAHEKTYHDSDLDGVVCAYHGGHGNFNNYIFDGLTIEGEQWSFVSVNMERNNWSPKDQSIGNISSIILRNVKSEVSFPAPPEDAYHLWGRSETSRLDMWVYDNVVIGAGYLNNVDIVPGVNQFATDIITCIGCTGQYFPSLADSTEWSTDERCGRAPQPSILGVFQLPPLSDHIGESPICAEVKGVSQPTLWAKADPAAPEKFPLSWKDPKFEMLQWLHSTGATFPRPRAVRESNMTVVFI